MFYVVCFFLSTYIRTRQKLNRQTKDESLYSSDLKQQVNFLLQSNFTNKY